MVETVSTFSNPVFFYTESCEKFSLDVVHIKSPPAIELNISFILRTFKTENFALLKKIFVTYVRPQIEYHMVTDFENIRRGTEECSA